jgi:hypothetical protein
MGVAGQVGKGLGRISQKKLSKDLKKVVEVFRTKEASMSKLGWRKNKLRGSLVTGTH